MEALIVPPKWESQMPRPEDIESVEDIKLWIADHAARCDERTKQQGKLNGQLEDQLCMHDKRITSAEKKMWIVAGFAAALGSTVGPAIIKAVIG